MLSNNAKRYLSVGVFLSGTLAGLWACGASVQPIFVIGANDTLPGILALLLAFDTPFWVCLIALWHRKFAGWWLALVGLYFPLGLYSEMFSKPLYGPPRNTSVEDYVLGSVIISGPLLAVGLFGILTDRAGWPKMFWKNYPGE